MPEDLKDYHAPNEAAMQRLEWLLWAGIALTLATLVVVVLHLGGPG